MDDPLRPASPDVPNLRILLAQERARREELAQKVVRLRAALARQKDVLIALQQREREWQREREELRTLVAGLTEQNRLLREQAAQLHQENARLCETPLALPPDPASAVKPATPKREKNVRKKRAHEHNHGRLKLERANRWVNYAAERCPQWGEQLSGGWIHRRIQVIDLPVTAPLEITQHRIFRRQCPKCKRWALPKRVGLEAGRMGCCRFGPRLIAAISVMHTVERLPQRTIQDRLKREYGLTLSHGGIVELLHRMAHAGTPAYMELNHAIRGSPVVHADETGWREEGQHTTLWTVSTSQSVYVSHGRRTNEAIDAILGSDFAGTIVCDCYASYDHFLGAKQRCWAHLLRDLDALLHEHADQTETVAWVEGVRWIYAQAAAPRPAPEDRSSYHAVRAREQRARRYESLLLLLCPANLDATAPYATLACRLRTHLLELFTFVRDPQVQATNNAAERSLRPLVIARKVSGGTRSEAGSTTRMILYSLCATARMQGKDPAVVCQQILLAPSDAPSPLTPAPF